MLRRLVILSVLLGTLGAPLVAPSAAVAATTCGPGVRGDIDGNGIGDLVVGATRYYSGTRPVTTFDVILYPGGERTSIDAPDIDGAVEPSVSLRRAAIGDLNGDGCADVAFAADQNTIPVTAGTRVYVVPGSSHGLVLDQAIRIDVPGDHVQQVAVLPRSTGSQVAVTTTTASRQNALHMVTLNAALEAVQTTTVTAASLGIACSQE